MSGSSHGWVTLADGSAGYWTTLGVAHYRAGYDRGALAAICKSLGLRPAGTTTDWFFLALAYERTGDPIAARQCFDKAVALSKTQPLDPDQLRFAAEVQTALKIEKAAARVR